MVYNKRKNSLCYPMLPSAGNRFCVEISTFVTLLPMLPLFRYNIYIEIYKIGEYKNLTRVYVIYI